MQQSKAGRDSIVVGRDYEKKTTINISLWISILIIVIVALGSTIFFTSKELGEIFPGSTQNTESITDGLKK
ncbi:hypothetical protein [Acaryochloris marina]|uniref:hypothetical protein n=1 Tax=Acaryochloris marina TaxID=155978 RepID=UPI0021C3FE4E|nr:hypothetical protein [Acaryochloris marina]BDM83787.1 hypothetical protein AM10699_66480 [Acaryochloris marina MBIC10699]